MTYTLYQGDCIEVLKTLPAQSVHCVITSPPYFGLRDYGHAGQIGLEQTPAEYVAKLVQVFREVWRVLRDDGTVFLNLGDSYFGGGGFSPNSPSSATSKSGKYGAKGALISGHTRAGAQRAAAYGTSGKALEDYQDRDCLCGNLCDVCRVVYRSHKFRNDGLLAAMLTVSLSAPNQGHTESGRDHLPTSDLIHLESHNVHAIQDRPRTSHLVGERLRAVLVSTIGESSPQLLDVCLQRANQGDVCLLCARSLTGCAQGYAGRSDDLPGQGQHNQGNASRDDQRVHHNLCTDTACECCIDTDSYRYYTTPYHDVQLKPKDLIGIPWRVAFALQADGWYLRSDIIWHKPNPMPESVTDRPTKSHEYLFLLTKAERYYYDADAIAEPAVTNDMRRPYGSQGAWQLDGRPEEQRPNGQLRGKAGKNAFRGQGHFRDGENGPANRDGREMQDVGAGLTRNRRDVWTIATKPYLDAHFATYPVELVQPCIQAGTSAHGCCAACGAPWVRVVEVESRPNWNGNGQQKHDGTYYRPNIGGGVGNDRRERHELGWEPSCACGAPVVPCTVLDPFNGSGTTGVAAIGLGRHYTGIDINPEYLDLSHERLGRTQPALLAV